MLKTKLCKQREDEQLLLKQVPEEIGLAERKSDLDLSKRENTYSIKKLQ